MENSTVLTIHSEPTPNLGQALLKQNPQNIKDFTRKLLISAKHGDIAILHALEKQLNSRQPSCIFNEETNAWTEDDVSVWLEIDADHQQNIIHVAAERGHLKFIKEVFRIFGAKTCRATDPDLGDADDWTPVLLAVHDKRIDVVKYFLSELGDENERRNRLEQKDGGGWTPLMWACYSPDDKSVLAELLLKLGANVNIKASYQMSPLLWAAGRGHTEVVRLLIENASKTEGKSLDIAHSDRFGSSAVYWAARSGYVNIVDLLIKANNDDFTGFDHIGAHNMSPLTVAIKTYSAFKINLVIFKVFRFFGRKFHSKNLKNDQIPTPGQNV